MNDQVDDGGSGARPEAHCQLNLQAVHVAPPDIVQTIPDSLLQRVPFRVRGESTELSAMRPIRRRRDRRPLSQP